MSERPGSYQRSPRGMLAALVVVVVAAAAFVGIRGLGQDNVPTPVAVVHYRGWAKSGRVDGKLDVMLPVPMPRGWRATSVSYVTGSDPHWHLGMLTDQGRYVGIEESWAGVQAMVRQYVDPAATRHGTVTVGGRRWQVWTDQGGDYALAGTRPSRVRHRPEAVLVVGDADPAVVRRLTGSLRPAH
ncbi:MAG TPA: DUF4245 family protein [Marmoricola sp.]|nr:DUF4245 family protein [Marmoricola sp.]